MTSRDANAGGRWVAGLRGAYTAAPRKIGNSRTRLIGSARPGPLFVPLEITPAEEQHAADLRRAREALGLDETQT